MKNTVYFNGKNVKYCSSGWRDDDNVFLFDFGDGELVDNDGDSYFIHLEYYEERNEWREEIWWEDEYLTVGEWTGMTAQLRDDLNDIEEFIEKELM